MILHLRRAFSSFLLISLIVIAQSQDKPEFPKISELEVEFYQTDVTVTNEDQLITVFGSEYFDSTGGPRGRVDVLPLGQKLTVFYNNDTQEIYETNSTSCAVWGIDESIYDYDPIFYGWLNKDPLIIGPSAPLWYAQNNRDKIVSLGSDFLVRDIKCDKFSLDYVTKRDNVTFYYYFANKNWKTPYNVEGLRVPIRIEVRGISSADSEAADEWEPINQYTDFIFFRPDISNWQIFQPPEGLGCPLRKVTRQMPKFPKVFTFSAEVVDLLKAETQEISDIEYQKIWYDYNEGLARMDKYTRLRYTSEFYDFNTGVTYSNIDYQTCTINALRKSFFEAFGDMMMGHMKEPAEVLGLDGDFYYMGKRLIRGIWCDVFESARLNQDFMKQTFAKLVVTIYYSQEYYLVAVDGETETRVPVFYAVKGYDENNKVITNLQYNIFAFDDVIYPDMYESFMLGRCFPNLQDKAYFVMVMSVEAELAAKMEGQEDYMMEQLRAQITETAKVSNHRIPLLTADYKTTGVFVTGQILDRPPALKQFWLEYEGDATTNDPYLRALPSADTKEKCAFGCVNYDGFTCTGFFWCSDTCFIKSKDILEPDDDKGNFNFGGKCEEWLRAESNSNNKEAYLADALKALENAVMNLTIKINVKIDARSDTVVPVTDIDIEEGPYTGDGKQEKPYDLVMNYAKLKVGDETTEALTYIDTLNDCYKACKDSKDLSCSSFSYCPSSSNKQCLISSVLVVDRKRNVDDTDPDPNCYVYSMKYLDFYDAYPGRLALIPGAKEFKGVKSTEECAKNCRQATDIMCRGFEYCQTGKTCVLHTKHVLDLTKQQIINTKKTTCIHYAARYAADYLDMGYTLVDDKSDTRTDLSLESCAKICSEELKDKCNSFNYCPASGEYMADSSCALTSLTLTSPRVTTTKKLPCHHYEKKSKVDDWGKAGVKKPIDVSGYTASGFTWLVIGMLILGFGLGAAGFVAYSYFKSKSSGEGMTVRFMKQDNA